MDKVSTTIGVGEYNYRGKKGVKAQVSTMLIAVKNLLFSKYHFEPIKLKMRKGHQIMLDILLTQPEKSGKGLTNN